MGRADPSLSIVLPVLNEAQRLPAQLRSLRAQFPDVELILVDGGSEDGSLDIATPLVSRCLSSAPGRARQMNAGAGCAGGDYLLFLHADTRPGYNQAKLLTVLQSDPAWGFAPVQLSGQARSFRVIERAISLRSKLTGVATGDQGLFVRRSLFDHLRGFAEIPLMEDVEFSKRLRRESRPVVLPWPVCTSSRRWEERGVASTILQMWYLRLAYYLGVSPSRLHARYYG
ncbi:MAG: TIGR04283 family arsenosugar biosynthesis glycosyltransferase [Pseudomonadota bacterium]